VSTLDPATERERWTQTVQSLCDQVTAWSESQGWQVARKEMEITEELLGAYAVPMLVIQTSHGALMLEPVARLVMGAQGRIDLYAYPTLFRVMLLRNSRDGRWMIRTDSGIFLRQPWNEETFLSLAADLAGASDES